MSAAGMIIAVICFFFGILGTFLPALPGAPLIWLGMLLYGFAVDFQGLALSFYLLQGAAVLLTFLIDYIASAYGTKKYGGSRAAVLGSILGLFLGALLLGPPGLIFGPFLGAFLMELLKGKAMEQSLQAAFGTLLGLLGGTILKLVIEAVMIGSFLWVVLR